MQTLICTVTSQPTISPDGQAELGFYQSEVFVDMEEVLRQPDPRGFINNEINRHLRGCVEHTEMPLGQELWLIEFTNFAQDQLNYVRGYTV